MKVSYFSPLPPSTSGIADYSALLLPALERLLEVEVVRPGRTRPIGDADIALYHVGNDPDAQGDPFGMSGLVRLRLRVGSGQGTAFLDVACVFLLLAMATFGSVFLGIAYGALVGGVFLSLTSALRYFSRARAAHA